MLKRANGEKEEVPFIDDSVWVRTVQPEGSSDDDTETTNTNVTDTNECLNDQTNQPVENEPGSNETNENIALAQGEIPCSLEVAVTLEEQENKTLSEDVGNLCLNEAVEAGENCLQTNSDAGDGEIGASGGQSLQEGDDCLTLQGVYQIYLEERRVFTFL